MMEMSTTDASTGHSAPGSNPAEDFFLGDNQIPSSRRVLICSLYEDQRPLKGTAGILDWRLRGTLSRFLINGQITGQRNEVVYIPIKHHGAVRHLILVGLGPSAGSQVERETFNSDLLKKLAQTIENLQFKQVAISRSNFAFLSESLIRKSLKGVEVEFTE